MNWKKFFYIRPAVWLIFGMVVLLACGPAAPTPSPTPEITSEASVQPLSAGAEVQATETASPTPVPLAAVVNQEPISLAEYQIELALYQAAVGRELSAEDKKQVMDSLVDQVLMAQAAKEDGYSLDDAALETRIEQLADQMGSRELLDKQVQAQGYTPELFRQALSRSLYAAWMRDQITQAIPLEAEQVQARQILMYTKDEAEKVLSQLKAGNDFGNLALQYDQLTGGNLLWFPRGYLLDQDLEEAVFNLQPGEYTPVIETLAGFHIVQVLEREPSRALDADALQVLQTNALQEWLEQRYSQSQIQILAK